MLKSLLFSCFSFILLIQGSKSSSSSDNSSLFFSKSSFFLQDDQDEQCLNSYGFSLCDETAVWILIQRSESHLYSLINLFSSNEKGICLGLQRRYFQKEIIELGSCKIKSSQNWDFQFINSNMMVILNGNFQLQRGEPFHSSISLSSSPIISTSTSSIDINKALKYLPTNVHEAGFFIKSSDGLCFDGNSFKLCYNPSSILWGIGIKFINQEATRFIHLFHNHSVCIESKGLQVYRGTCDKKTAYGWSFSQGRLQFDGGRVGKYLNQLLPSQTRCVVRKGDKNGLQMASMRPCKEGFEYLLMELPSTFRLL